MINSQVNKFKFYSFFSTFVSSMESMLSTHSMLSTAGLASSELAISVNFFGKDIIGQIGSLYYIRKLGNQADTNSKYFMDKGLKIEQVCTIIEGSTPLLPLISFIPVSSVANIGKNISFTMTGAMNAKAIQKLTTQNEENQTTIGVGELYTNLTVLNTLASSLGMISGLGIISILPDHETRLFIIPVLGFLRIRLFKKSMEDLF